MRDSLFRAAHNQTPTAFMQNITALQKKLEQYLRESLLRKLGFQQKQFTLEATALGIHNHVFFLTVAGERPLVIKGVTNKDRFQTALHSYRHLAGHGIRVPRVLYTRQDRGLWNRLGMHIICEERIMGKTVFELPQPEKLIPDIARFFSRLHGIMRPAWGTIDGGRHTGLYEYLLERAVKKLKTWQQQDPGLSPAFTKQCSLWMKTGKRSVQGIATFSLSHGDPNPGNIMLSNDGTLYLLDIGHIRYLPRALDFYALEVHYCQDHPDRIQLFEENYFSDVPLGEKDTFFASHLFFKLYVLIDFAQNLVRRLRTVAEHHPWHQEFTANLHTVTRAIAEIIEQRQ
jgi:aminoglycoside phosphotransferase (APT) family kinase protein